MMRLVQVQTIMIEHSAGSELGQVPLLGKSAQTSRGWFTCETCGLVAALEPMNSPMRPPDCPAGCDGPEQ